MCGNPSESSQPKPFLKRTAWSSLGAGEQELVYQKLQECSLFEGLGVEKLGPILAVAKVAEFENGEIVVAEGASDQSIFLLLSGSVSIEKTTSDGEEAFKLQSLQVGDVFGEMAYVTGERRSATIRAEAGARVLAIDTAAWMESTKSPQSRITFNIARALAEKLDASGTATVDALKRDLEHTRYRLGMTQFLLGLMFTFLFYVFAMAFVSLIPGNTTLIDVFSNVTILVCSIVCVAFIVMSPFSLSTFGFRWPRRWIRDLFETMTVTLGLMLGSVVIKWVAIQNLPELSEVSLFYFPGMDVPGRDSIQEFWFTFGYVLFVPLQEIIVRGSLQSSLFEFFKGSRWCFVISVFVSNGIFAMTHLHISFSLAVVTFFVGTIWGILYHQQKSLVGVTISHTVLGLFVFNTLGMAHMLRILGI